MLGVLSLFSCTQEENAFLVDENSRTEVQELTAAEAQSKFARILSKAVSGSVEVRRFLKDEALKQFDNDYDVFYPYVKDKVVQGSQTFRDILLSYCDSDKELEQVEQAGAQAPDQYQFLRLGYFCVDSKDSKPGALVFNRAVSLKDSFKPGK